MRILNDEEIEAVHDKWGSNLNSEDYITMLLKEQYNQDIKDFITKLNSGHNVDYIRECLSS